MSFGPPPVIPTLAPYGQLSQSAVKCVAKASAYYRVPELLMYSILWKEDGRAGMMNKNRNGTYDLGPAQINTSWLFLFSSYGITLKDLRYNECTNIYAEAWVLKYNANKLSGNWFRAAMAYNIGANAHDPTVLRIGYRYAVSVIHIWWKLRAYAETHPQLLASNPGPKVFSPN